MYNELCSFWVGLFLILYNWFLNWFLCDEIVVIFFVKYKFCWECFDYCLGKIFFRNMCLVIGCMFVKSFYMIWWNKIGN